MLMQRAARWRPGARRRAGPAITPTVRDPLLRADRLVAGGLAAALLSGLALAWRGRAEAAVVDSKLVPDRLSPGFQHRLSRPAVLLACAGFAAGLLLANRIRR
jgi:hypothetical protein